MCREKRVPSLPQTFEAPSKSHNQTPANLAQTSLPLQGRGLAQPVPACSSAGGLAAKHPKPALDEKQTPPRTQIPSTSLPALGLQIRIPRTSLPALGLQQTTILPIKKEQTKGQTDLRGASRPRTSVFFAEASQPIQRHESTKDGLLGPQIFC